VSVAFADTSIKIIAPTINVSAAADDDGMPWPHRLTLSWEVVQGEAGNVSIASPDAQSTDVTFSAVGDYVLRFTADDGELHDMAEVSVEVSLPDNNAPVVGVAFTDSTIVTGSMISVSATASDDGYPDPPAGLTYSWTVTSGNAANVTIASPDQLTTDVTISATGNYVLQISVSDGELNEVAEVSITVTSPDNVAPEVSVAYSDSTIDRGATISVSATASDDGYPDPPAALTYSWTVTSGNAADVTIASPDQLTTDVTISALGDYVLQISVSDGEVSTTRTVSITTQIPESIEALGSGVRMYPNPASDVLTIELQNVGPSDIRIFDLTGKPVYIDRHVNSSTEIDVSGFESGIYFVTVTFGKESVISRLNILK
jgi:DUF971 family protein